MSRRSALPTLRQQRRTARGAYRLAALEVGLEGAGAASALASSRPTRYAAVARRPRSSVTLAAALQRAAGPARHCVRVVTDSAINRDTTKAGYITPENSSSMTRARAIGSSGTMSPSPTPDIVVKLRKRSSIHVRGLPEPTSAPEPTGAVMQVAADHRPPTMDYGLWTDIDFPLGQRRRHHARAATESQEHRCAEPDRPRGVLGEEPDGRERRGDEPQRCASERHQPAQQHRAENQQDTEDGGDVGT